MQNQGIELRNTEIVKNMLRKGYEIDFIQQVTKLDLYTVEKIKRELE